MLKWFKNLISNVFKRKRKSYNIVNPKSKIPGKYKPFDISINKPVKYENKLDSIIKKGEKIGKLLNTFNDYVYKLGNKTR